MCCKGLLSRKVMLLSRKVATFEVAGFWGHGAPMVEDFVLQAGGRWKRGCIQNQSISTDFNQIRLQVKLGFLRWLRATDPRVAFWQLAGGQSCRISFWA